MRLQDIPRQWARRCLAIPRFCQHVLDTDLRKATLVIAYSTGLDSTALLYLLHALTPKLNLRLIAAHAHHGLRTQSDAELVHAQATCRGLGVVCETARLEIPREQTRLKQGLEESARTLRYAFLENVRIKHQADWIVTAHHADDLAEDIILRLIRGTGWPGLGGMAGKDSQRRVLRPLLDWKKCDLRSLLIESGIHWCEDQTNADTDRTRNRVRHHIIPLLEQENPAFSTTSHHLWRLARLDEAYWSARMPTSSAEGTFFLDSILLRAAHPAKRLRLFKAALDSLGPGQALADHLFRLDLCWQNCAWGKTIQFPGDKLCRVEKRGITFTKKQAK